MMEQAYFEYHYSNSNDSSEIESHGSPKKLCLICGNNEGGSHFNSTACRACAAFFRRSVSYKRQYVCVNDPIRCAVNAFYGSPPRHMCKLCRFSRCIRSGLSMNYIMDRTVDEFQSICDSSLKQIIIAQRATFVNRYAAQLKMCGGDHALVRMGKESCVFANKMAIASEFIVLTEYLNASGFSDYDLAKTDIICLSKELFHSWLTFRAIVTTLRNTSQAQNNICYFVDDSFVQLDEESIYEYVKSCPGLMDYHMAAKYAYKCCSDKINYANKLRMAQLTELELSVLFHVFALKKAQQLFGSTESLKLALNGMFEALKMQYTCEEMALRIGAILLLLGDFDSWANSLTEFVVMLSLNGYNTLFSSSNKDNDQCSDSNLPSDPKN